MTFCFQLGQGLGCVFFFEQLLLSSECQFSRRTYQMLGHNLFVKRIDNGSFRFTVDKILRISHKILVEGIISGNQYQGRILAAAADPAAALPG